MLNITPIPALSDNYIWLISEENQVVIVDPAQTQPVLDFLTKHQLHPTAIWLTHNHSDHTDGVAGLKAIYPELPVYGSAELQEFADHIVQDGDEFEWRGKTVKIIKSAGHTADHISYLLASEHLFCGDSLFYGGCGRTFTGDYQAQFDTLQRFNALPDYVQIYCGHEYTLSNLKFAEQVLPPSCLLAEHLELSAIKREQGKPTLPSSIGVEKQINPFLRAKTVEEFTTLRQKKDNN